MNHYVNDLGVAAFIMMHGFKLLRKTHEALYFEVDPNEVEEFEKLQMDYLNSEFHRFDSCLMAIKKMRIR